MSHIDVLIHKVNGQLVLGINGKIPGQLLASYLGTDPGRLINDRQGRGCQCTNSQRERNAQMSYKVAIPIDGRTAQQDASVQKRVFER